MSEAKALAHTDARLETVYKVLESFGRERTPEQKALHDAVSRAGARSIGVVATDHRAVEKTELLRLLQNAVERDEKFKQLLSRHPEKRPNKRTRQRQKRKAKLRAQKTEAEKAREQELAECRARRICVKCKQYIVKKGELDFDYEEAACGHPMHSYCYEDQMRWYDRCNVCMAQE